MGARCCHKSGFIIKSSQITTKRLANCTHFNIKSRFYATILTIFLCDFSCLMIKDAVRYLVVKPLVNAHLAGVK
ncbi:hypothetical protein B0181_02960 [Moraxella caviae]|uniref:Uncharacterized protein n=1 Tax=Moraxella caviae TaxID=34060 RepID=A0A1T0A786_9GAMM|nr:hypothetical protein B0181_02960 [Moraxella caviae]